MKKLAALILLSSVVACTVQASPISGGSVPKCDSRTVCYVKKLLRSPNPFRRNYAAGMIVGVAGTMTPWDWQPTFSDKRILNLVLKDLPRRNGNELLANVVADAAYKFPLACE